jgi:hypothetical protein
MASSDQPQPHEASSEAADGSPFDALRRLEQRLERASEAAERLIAEASVQSAARVARSVAHNPDSGIPASGSDARAAESDPLVSEPDLRPSEPDARAAESDARGSGSGTGPADPSKPPPAGWQSPEEADSEPAARRASELELLTTIAQSMRDLIPAELQRRLAEALRELLLALRALLDWYLERLESERTESHEVQDIPIL